MRIVRNLSGDTINWLVRDKSAGVVARCETEEEAKAACKALEAGRPWRRPALASNNTSRVVGKNDKKKIAAKK